MSTPSTRPLPEFSASVQDALNQGTATTLPTQAIHLLTWGLGAALLLSLAVNLLNLLMADHPWSWKAALRSSLNLLPFAALLLLVSVVLGPAMASQQRHASGERDVRDAEVRRAERVPATTWTVITDEHRTYTVSASGGAAICTATLLKWHDQQGELRSSSVTLRPRASWTVSAPAPTDVLDTAWSSDHCEWVRSKGLPAEYATVIAVQQ